MADSPEGMTDRHLDRLSEQRRELDRRANRIIEESTAMSERLRALIEVVDHMARRVERDNSRTTPPGK